MRNIYLGEGPDRVGKTEISQQFASIFGGTYFKNKNEGLRFYEGEDPKLAFKYETQVMLNVLKQFSYSGLCLDRSIVSEYAYAKALNRDFDEELIWKFDEDFAKLDAKIILCYRTHYTNFEDEYVTEDIQGKVLEYYREYLAKTKMKYIEVCTDSEDLVDEFAQIFKSGIIFDDYEDAGEE